MPNSHAVRLRVEADRPVNIYVFDSKGLDAYLSGRLDFHSFCGKRKRRVLDGVFSILFGGDWYLILANSAANEVNVAYETESAP